MIIRTVCPQNPDVPFKGPSNVSFGYRPTSKELCLWHSDRDEFDTNYLVLVTGMESLEAAGDKLKLRASVQVDGWLMFHLCEVLP